MNSIYNKNLNKLALKLLIWVVILKFLNITAVYFLPKFSTYKAPNKSLDLPYFAIRLDKSFKTKKVIKQTELDAQKLYQITDLTLKAIYGSSRNKKYSFIMVLEKNEKDTQLLSIGDSIRKYKLVDIKSKEKEAIFEANGKLYTLRIDKIKDKKFPKSSSIVASSLSGAKQNLNDTILVIPRGEVLRYRKNYKNIWKNISIKEVVKNGRINGFLITRIKSNTIFSRLGLREGDVIKSLNNNPLKSYADAFKVYYTIERAKAIKITIIRNKQEKELEYEIY